VDNEEKQIMADIDDVLIKMEALKIIMDKIETHLHKRFQRTRLISENMVELASEALKGKTMDKSATIALGGCVMSIYGGQDGGSD